MHQTSPSAFQPLPQKFIGPRKKLQDILILDIIDFNDVMPVIPEQLLVQRESQGRNYMGDVGVPQGFFGPQSKQSGDVSRESG